LIHAPKSLAAYVKCTI